VGVEQVAARPGDAGVFLALAPMDGVTDWVHRRLATQGAGRNSPVSLCVSEFVRVTDRVVPDRILARHCPELERGGKTESGVPVFVQLLGGDPAAMAQSAARAAQLGAPGVDLNFGCPAKRVNQHDGGAALLRAPVRIERITSAVRAALPPHVPVTVKIRVGWDDSRAVETLARAAEQGGASWLTIHARTRVQMYAPGVDWEAIGRARLAVRMPVVANGDVWDGASLRACREASGCDAFMLGRGALARPDVFGRLRGQRPPAGLVRFEDWLLRYDAYLMDAGLCPERRARRLKQWLSLAASVDARHRPLFDRLKRLPTSEQMRGPLAETAVRERVTAA